MKSKLGTVQESLASIAKGEPVFQRWDDYRREFKLASGPEGEARFQRIEYPAIEAPLVKGRLVVVPTGKLTPPQMHDVDTVFLCVEGEVEVSISSQVYVLKPLDLLSIPAGSSYSYANSGLVQAQLCQITAKNDPSAPAGATKTAAAPHHMVWGEYRRDFGWTLPLAEQWGYHRGSGPLIISDGLRGHTVRMPIGQSTPWHYAARDMLFMGIYHEVDFAAANQVFTLTPRDFLIVPAGTPYQYTNCGLHEVVFFSIGGKLPPGKKGTYFDGDPGWPIRADAKTIQVEIDKAGDAKVVGNSR